MLHVTPVGLQHDFFRLGGHSLRATRVTSRLFELFNTRVPLQTVFDATRLGDFVALFSEHLGGSESGQRTLALLARFADEDLPVDRWVRRLPAAGRREQIPTPRQLPAAAIVVRPGTAVVPRPARAGLGGLQRPRRPPLRGPLSKRRPSTAA